MVTRASSFNSGAFRFALILAGVFALGCGLLFVAVERAIHAYAEAATEIGLNAQVTVLSREAPDGDPVRLAAAIDRNLVVGDNEPFHYLLTDAHGARLAGDLPLSAAKLGRSSVRFADNLPDPDGDNALETLQTLGFSPRPGLLAVVATDTFDVQALRTRVNLMTLFAAIAITSLVLAGGYGVSVLFLRRLERVNQAVSRVMAGQLSERLPPIGLGPEMDELARNLNAMLDRIGELMEGLRQVSTDIAHDMRTPLTRLRQQLEALRGGSPEAYEAGAEAALAQADEILQMFAALLQIGALEGGSGRHLLAPVDLAEVLGRVALAYQTAAEDEGKTLRVRAPDAVEIAGNADLLTHVFTNLFDNALKYTPAGATIVAEVTVADGTPTVSVADDGPGVPDAERARLTRRFYRVDRSRNAPGSGLGLSLVAAIARLHHARLSIEDNRPGLRVALAFPRVERPASSPG